MTKNVTRSSGVGFSQPGATRTVDETQALLDLAAELPRKMTKPRHLFEIEDSVEIIRQSRIERSAQSLRVSGKFDSNDPLWWDVARITTDKLTRARKAIFGERVFTDDSTDILWETRESPPGTNIEP